MNSDLFDYSQYPNVEVSYENRSVIVNGYAETAYEDTKASFVITNKAYMYLSLKLGKSVPMNYIIRDGVTGEVFYSLIWPQETGESSYIPIHEYNFSPLPK